MSTMRYLIALLFAGTVSSQEPWEQVRIYEEPTEAVERCELKGTLQVKGRMGLPEKVSKEAVKVGANTVVITSKEETGITGTRLHDHTTVEGKAYHCP